ncbi:hypothetical protein DL767_008269 [Monosporascus sp. MG133]|nr:hypothetical protein DL767_008269 [Monosporascus sp. MG133]
MSIAETSQCCMSLAPRDTRVPERLNASIVIRMADECTSALRIAANVPGVVDGRRPVLGSVMMVHLVMVRMMMVRMMMVRMMAVGTILSPRDIDVAVRNVHRRADAGAVTVDVTAVCHVGWDEIVPIIHQLLFFTGATGKGVLSAMSGSEAAYEDDSDWLSSDDETEPEITELREKTTISEDDATDEDTSQWEKYQADRAKAYQIAERVLKAFPGRRKGDGDRDKDESISDALRVIQEAWLNAPPDFKPTAFQIDTLVDFSNALRRRSENTGENGHANGNFLEEAIAAADVAIQALSPERPELPEQLDALSDMFAAKSEWSFSPDQDRMNSIDRAIDAAVRAVDITPSDDPNEATRLRNLSKLYESRFNLSNGSLPEDIDVAISCLQTILRDHPELEEETTKTLNNEIACLRLHGGDNDAVPSVFEVPYADLGKAPLVLDYVPPHRFRFLDCKAYVDKKALRILDFTTLPVGRYVAVSYVWKGLDKNDTSDDSHPGLNVKGAEDADPISAAVLRTACLASLLLECDMIWLDRLSIVQTNSSDKSWQIKNMYRIYTSCKDCLVLPGGLVRLADLAEATSWIQRAWTLQEAIAPPQVNCVFHWPWGKAVRLQAHFSMPITDIETGTSGMADLKSILQASLAPMGMQTTEKKSRNLGVQPINIFTNAKGVRASVEALLGALNQKNKPVRANAIWRSALLRTSSRPVDMIFSIMGLLGVMLEPSSFKKDDRHHATIELARALLAKGEAARWLGISLQLEPNPHLSTMPVMPETSVSGGAYIRTAKGLKEAASIVGDSWWWLKGAPRGSMDEDGYFRFRGRAVPVMKMTPENSQIMPIQNVIYGGTTPQRKVKVIKSNSKQKWALRPDLEASPGHDIYWAIAIENTVVMFVKEHAPSRWHNTEYGLIEDALAVDWKHKEFQVGGPKPIPMKR